MVAILPDLRNGSEAQDFTLLVPYLTQHASELGIDPNAIAVYAGSGNVFTAFPTVEDPKMSAIKAAVMYYGSAQVKEFRRDCSRTARPSWVTSSSRPPAPSSRS